jgi:hypothetical protein
MTAIARRFGLNYKTLKRHAVLNGLRPRTIQSTTSSAAKHKLPSVNVDAKNCSKTEVAGTEQNKDTPNVVVAADKQDEGERINNALVHNRHVKKASVG